MAADHDAGAHKCTFTVRIDVALEDQAFHAPSFRFRFLDGTKKQTPIIGATGWTAHPEKQQPGNWRFDAAIPDVVVTEALACAIDDDPIVAFVLSDQALPAAAATAAGGAKIGVDPKSRPTTAAAPPPPATQEVATSNHKTSGRGRLVADLFEMDASTLLTGDCLHLENTWVGSNNNITDTDGLDADASETSIFSRLNTKKSTQSRFGRSLFNTASGIRCVTIHITVDQPLLSPPLRKKLNPLAVTVATARRMPGIRGPPRAADQSNPNPHVALGRSCRPVYAQWRLFPDKRLHHNRLVVTHGREHSESIDWQHTTVILCGRADPLELYDAVQASSLTVEIHDRDLLDDDAPLQKLHHKWESLHSTGIDPTAPPALASLRPSATPSTSTTSSRHSTPRNASTAHAPPIKPLDAFAVDEIAKKDWRLLVARAGECFAYGAAVFRLDELLSKAKVLTAGPTDDLKPYMKLKLTADVLARKRRAQPIGASALAESDDPTSSGIAPTRPPVDLTPTDKLIREPGAYVATSTTLSLHVSLQHALARPGTTGTTTIATTAAPQPSNNTSSSLSPPLFSRFVVIFPYKDASTLKQVMRVVEAVNLHALPNGIPIRSYQMTAHEKTACANGELDVITGCMVLDDDLRMVILEGLANGGMAQVHRALPRTQQQQPGAIGSSNTSNSSFRMFANDQLRFTQRMYTAFEIDLKRIKLRYALPMLLKMPDIYMRTKVSELCYAALTKLMEMRRVGRLIEVKELDLFPSAEMLLEVESKYGESISLEDIYGKQKAGSSVASTTTNAGAAIGADPATTSEDDDGDENLHHRDGEETSSSQAYVSKRTHLKAPTDATNTAFDEYRRSRQDKDFIDTRKKLTAEQQHAYRLKRQEEDELHEKTGGNAAPVYMYSGQKLRSQDALQEELRKTLFNDHRATYTTGPEFQSLAWSLVNPDELRQIEEKESKKKWTTQKGFVYPMPRATSEYYKHPDVPSEARCEDLRMPFIDNVNHPKPVSRDNNRGSDPRSEFTTLPSKDLIFGGTNGDGTVNQEYFKSVHLCGEKLRKEMDDALQKEQQDWDRKLVVDRKQLKFLAHGNICSQPMSSKATRQGSQLDRLRDILHGPVRSKPLRIVRHATLPSGKLVPLQPPPASMLSVQEYEGPVAAIFANTLRANDIPLLATDATTGKPKDFHFPSLSDLLTPPVKKHTTHKEIQPVASHEKRGFLWSNHNQ